MNRVKLVIRQLLPQLKGPLPSIIALQNPPSEVETLLLRSIEWTTFMEATYDTALEQATVILRYFLGMSSVMTSIRRSYVPRFWTRRFGPRPAGYVATRTCLHRRTRRTCNGVSPLQTIFQRVGTSRPSGRMSVIRSLFDEQGYSDSVVEGLQGKPMPLALRHS